MAILNARIKCKADSTSCIQQLPQIALDILHSGVSSLYYTLCKKYNESPDLLINFRTVNAAEEYAKYGIVDKRLYRVLAHYHYRTIGSELKVGIEKTINDIR